MNWFSYPLFALIWFYSETVGPGGSPDENGETTIGALVIDGVTTTHVW